MEGQGREDQEFEKKCETKRKGQNLSQIIRLIGIHQSPSKALLKPLAKTRTSL